MFRRKPKPEKQYNICVKSCFVHGVTTSATSYEEAKEKAIESTIAYLVRTIRDVGRNQEFLEFELRTESITIETQFSKADIIEMSDPYRIQK